MNPSSASRRTGVATGAGREKIRVLVRMPNWLGDCVMALPACRLLRRALPDAEIVAACRGSVFDLVASQPDLDAVVRAGDKGAARLVSVLARGARELPAGEFGNGFALGILFTNSLSTALWMWRAGVRRRVGYNLDARRLFLSHPIPCGDETGRAHFVEYYLGLARHGLEALAPGASAGETADPELRVPDIAVNAEDKNAAAAAVAARGVAGPYAVFAPASAYGPVKDWPAEHYRELARLVRDRHGLPVIITGGAGQRETCAAIAAGLDGAFSVAGETRLGDFLGLVAGASLFVGGDSGGAHVAAGFGVPTLVVFGITNPVRTAPRGARVRLLGRGDEQDARLDTAAAKARAAEALRSIGVDETAEAIGALLKE